MAKRKDIKVFAREWRQKKGYTLERAASLVGMSVSYLSDLEKGAGGKRWNLGHIMALADAYGLDDFQELFHHPDRTDPLLTLVKGVSAEDRAMAEQVLRAVLKKTGTNG